MEEHFITNYLDIVRKAGLPVNGKNESAVCTSVKEWLHSEDSGQWLLIIVNADNLRSTTLKYLHTVLPVLCGTILFTTRNAELVNENVVLPKYEVKLQVMTVAESMTTFLGLIQTLTHQQDQAQDKITTLLELLEHLPLAIPQAVAYIRHMKILVDVCVERLQASDRIQSKLLTKPLTNYLFYSRKSSVS